MLYGLRQKEDIMPRRSKAAILVEPNTPLVIDEVAFPDPEPDQVLIKLFASGICHSQLHQIHRTPQTAHRGDPVTAIHELTGGGVDYAIDAIGAARTQEQILYATRPGGIGLKKGGTACLVGAVQELGRIDVEELRITQRTYTGTRGSLCRPDRDFPTFVRWYQRGQPR
jgi:Zn-dependent alcohol dehydrogenase